MILFRKLYVAAPIMNCDRDTPTGAREYRFVTGDHSDMGDRTPRWLRRLFHQRGPENRVHSGRDLGWAGPAATIEIDDKWRFEALAAAETPRQLLSAANGYLLKVLKHGRALAEDIDDKALMDIIDAECERLAIEITRSASSLKEAMRAAEWGPSDLLDA